MISENNATASENANYVQRCLNLASKGLGSVSPNPLVGAVIVYNNKIIGEGYHMKFGEGHAEVNAINSVAEKDKHLLSKSTLYVNLEPCSHQGKTPPCSDLIIKNKIPRVVVGQSTDPNPQVQGKGIRRMKAHNIEVITNVLEEKCIWLNRRFQINQIKKRPYIILKWAQSKNKFFAPTNTEQKWITGPLSKHLVHKWRSHEDAILVGTNTYNTDNPQLNVRLWQGKNPIRLAFERETKLNPDLNLFNQNQSSWIFSSCQPSKSLANNTEVFNWNFEKQSLSDWLDFLYKKEIYSIFIEGGSKLLTSFIEQNLWDEAKVFTGSENWKEGLLAPHLNSAQLIQTKQIQNDQLDYYIPKNSLFKAAF